MLTARGVMMDAASQLRWLHPSAAVCLPPEKGNEGLGDWQENQAAH